MTAKIDTNFGWFTAPTQEHLVQFYHSEDSLLVNLDVFIGSGLLNAENCVIIATAPHIKKITARLSREGADVAALRESGQLVFLNASATLKKFMVDGMPDRTLFYDVIGKLIEAKVRKEKPIRAYGEMVAVLWQEGNKKAVLQLEELWNELGSRLSFSLYCAYPDLHFIMNKGVKQKISHCHSIQSPATA